jgi:UDP-galactopyranose mutase
MKTMTLKVPDELYDDVKRAAELMNVTVSEHVRNKLKSKIIEPCTTHRWILVTECADAFMVKKVILPITTSSGFSHMFIELHNSLDGDEYNKKFLSMIGKNVDVELRFVTSCGDIGTVWFITIEPIKMTFTDLDYAKNDNFVTTVECKVHKFEI